MIDAVVVAGADGARPSVIVDESGDGSIAVRTRVVGALETMLAERRAASVAAASTNRSADDAVVTAAVRAAAALAPAVAVDVDENRGEGYRAVTAGQYATVGELVLFIFLIALTGAGDIVESRRLGVTRRAVAAPVRPVTVVLGEGLGRFAIATSQAVLIVGVTALLFGISWGNPIGVAVIIGSFALLATAVAMAVGALARSSEQAVSFGPIVGIGLGCSAVHVAPGDRPARGRAGRRFTPHSWAVDGLVGLMGRTATVGEVALAAGVLLGAQRCCCRSRLGAATPPDGVTPGSRPPVSRGRRCCAGRAARAPCRMPAGGDRGRRGADLAAGESEDGRVLERGVEDAHRA